MSEDYTPRQMYLLRLAAGTVLPDTHVMTRIATRLMLRDELDKDEALDVEEAREKGYLWRELAGVFGMTRQAVQQRFGDVHGDRGDDELKTEEETWEQWRIRQQQQLREIMGGGE